MLFSSLEMLHDELNLTSGMDMDLLYIADNMQHLLSPNPPAFGCHNTALYYHLSAQYLRSQVWFSAKCIKMPSITLVGYVQKWDREALQTDWITATRVKDKSIRGHYSSSSDWYIHKMGLL